MSKLSHFTILAALAAFMASPASTAAGRIQVSDCQAFEKEHSDLLAAGIREDIEKGAEWGKANLPKERLDKIARFIEVTEYLDFRCPNVIASAAVRKMEEQARLRAAARQERERLWMERMLKIEPPVRNPETRVAKASGLPRDGTPPLPVRKSR